MCYIIIYHDFLHPSKRGSHAKSDYALTIVQHLPLRPYTSYLHLDSSSCTLFTAYSTASCNGIPPVSRCEATRAREGCPKEPRKKSKKGCFLLNYLHMHHSLLSFAHCRSTSTVILLLPKATFTPSIQPYL